MKERINSIRFRSWIAFVLFSIIVILFLYFFQVVLLSSYYEYMKIQETATAAKQIKDAWYQEPDNLNSIVSNIADTQKIYIEISDNNRPYFRASSLDKSNKEVYSLITSLDFNDMKEIVSGENTFFTATIPRTNNDSKAIILIAQLDDGTQSTFFETNGVVRLYIFNYLEPLGTTTTILHSQLNLTAAIIIIIAFIMSIFFSNSISKPIIKISKAALKLPKGEFDMPREKHQFTEIKELTQTLTTASEEIAKTDDLRKELMANISHDLRTPLTMIKAYAEMIRDLSGDNPEKREKHLKVIIDETDRLTSLVTDILDLSKLQSGVAEMNYETIDFSSHLADIVPRFSLLDEIKDYKVLLNAEPGIMIRADITKIDQVVYNFINNALTYTGEDKTVRVGLYRCSEKSARLEVCDSGIGIDAENLKYIWDRYYRVKTSGETHQRAKKGSGLGLSIVKGVLEMHKFRYGADSAVGVGSTFWFEFDIPIQTDVSDEDKKARKSKNKS